MSELSGGSVDAGYAEGVDVLFDDVIQVFGTADAMHLTDVVTGLAGLRPSVVTTLHSP